MFLAPLVFVVVSIMPSQPEAAPSPGPEPTMAVATAAPASSPSPDATASAGPKPTATPKVPLKEIGHVTAVTAFCKAFITHFNASAQLMNSDDAEISYADFVLGKLKKDFESIDHESRLYHDRLDLAEYLKILQAQMPKLQDAINRLRLAAALTIDPDKAKEAREVASQLQKSLDKEKQIANDTQGVLHAMLERAASYSDTLTSLGSPAEFPAATTVPVAPYLPSRRPAAEDDIRSYLEMDRQRDRIGDAESAAMTHADVVMKDC